MLLYPWGLFFKFLAKTSIMLPSIIHSRWVSSNAVDILHMFNEDLIVLSVVKYKANRTAADKNDIFVVLTFYTCSLLHFLFGNAASNYVTWF